MRPLFIIDLATLRAELEIPDSDDDYTLQQEIDIGKRRVANHMSRYAAPSTMASRPDVLEILSDAIFLYACFRFKSRKKSTELANRYKEDYEATLMDAVSALKANPGNRARRRMSRTRHDEQVPHIFSQSYGLGDFLP